MSPKFTHALSGPGLTLALVLGFWGLVLWGGTPTAQASKCPNLVIVLDKSASMTSAPSGATPPPGGSKWELAKVALKELLKTHDGQLPVGIALFASDAGCGAARLDIAPDYGTASKIGMLIDTRSPDSSTPTSESITSVARETALHDPSRSQYLLLLTDGEPNCASGEPTTTVNAIAAAQMQTPSITTFVVGFGVLSAAASAAMDRMAEAGGAPSMGTPQKFYAATDLTTLKASLEKIFSIVGGAGACDDSCYVTGCPRLTDLCILGTCRPNPCAGVSCPLNQYCYTDGVTSGTCLPACSTPCAAGKRCRGGACVTDPCGGFCGLAVCDPGSHKCVPDSRCTGVVCKGTSSCLAGTCAEDPCHLITCPMGTRCVPWEGTCEYDDGRPVADMGGGIADMSSTDLAGWVPPDSGEAASPDLSGGEDLPPVGGCSSAPGSLPSASLFAMFFMAGTFLLLRRRKRA